MSTAIAKKKAENASTSAGSETTSETFTSETLNASDDFSDNKSLFSEVSSVGDHSGKTAKKSNKPKPSTQLKLYVQIKSCRDLPMGNANGSDPYVKVKMGRKDLHTTKPVFKTFNPHFLEEHDNWFPLNCTARDIAVAGGLTFIVKDNESGDDLGKVRIAAKTFYNPKGDLREYKLKPMKGSQNVGLIRLRIREVPPEEDQGTSPARESRANQRTYAGPRRAKTPPPPRQTSAQRGNSSQWMRSRTPSPPRSKRLVSDLDDDKSQDEKSFGKEFHSIKEEEDYVKEPLKIITTGIDSSRSLIRREEQEEVHTKVLIRGKDLNHTLSLIKAARKMAPDFQSIEIHGLEISDTREDFMLAEEISKQAHLRKLYLFDFGIKHFEINPPLLETIPELHFMEELEIRMKEDTFLPEYFVFNLCQTSRTIKSLLLSKVMLGEQQISILCQSSSVLQSLVFWNVQLDFKQLKMVCEGIKKNKTLKRFELWCSNLGDNFGVLLGDMLEANTTLETMVVSHVGLYGASCIALMDALKSKNKSLRHLTLLSIAETDKDTVSKAVMQMMTDNKALKSFSVTYEQLTEDDCLQVSKDIKRKMVLKKWLKHRQEVAEMKNRMACAIL